MLGIGVLKRRRETARQRENRRLDRIPKPRRVPSCPCSSLLTTVLSICSLVPQDRGHRYSVRREEKNPKLTHFYVLPCPNPTGMRSIVPNSIRPHHSIVPSCLLFNITFSIYSSGIFALSPSSPTFLCSAFISFLLFYLTFRCHYSFIPPNISTSSFSRLLCREFGARVTEEKERLNKGS